MHSACSWERRQLPLPPQPSRPAMRSIGRSRSWHRNTQTALCLERRAAGKHELTLTLRDLAAGLAGLTPARRSAADRLLARPTGKALEDWGPAYAVPEARAVRRQRLHPLG